MLIPAFGPWDQSVHLQPDQVARIQRAQKPDVTPDSVDAEHQSCIIRGSGKNPYYVTLSACTCNDFTKRHLPCKHIYRLAAELKIIQIPLKRGVCKPDQFTLEEAVSAIEALSIPAQQQMLEFISDLVYGPGTLTAIPLSPVSEELKTCPLLSYQDALLSEVISTFSRDDLLDVCSHIAVSPAPKKNASKTTLSAWILDHADVCTYDFPKYISFSFIPHFQICARSAYSYLLRKLNSNRACDDNGFCDIPCGSERQGDGKYYFPDDKVTALLTLYGHNRCLGGFVPTYDNNTEG